MLNRNSEKRAEVRVRLEGPVLEFIESRRRRQTKIPPRIEIIRQILEQAASSEGKAAAAAVPSYQRGDGDSTGESTEQHASKFSAPKRTRFASTA
jgi:hypothetical protein